MHVSSRFHRALPALLLLGISALGLLNSTQAATSATSPTAASSLTVSGNNTFLSGSRTTFAAGSNITISGNFGANPTGGTINLSNATVTLGSPTMTGNLTVSGPGPHAFSGEITTFSDGLTTTRGVPYNLRATGGDGVASPGILFDSYNSNPVGLLAFAPNTGTLTWAAQSGSGNLSTTAKWSVDVNGNMTAGGQVISTGDVITSAGALFKTPDFGLYQTGGVFFIRDLVNSSMALRVDPGATPSTTILGNGIVSGTITQSATSSANVFNAQTYVVDKELFLKRTGVQDWAIRTAASGGALEFVDWSSTLTRFSITTGGSATLASSGANATMNVYGTGNADIAHLDLKSGDGSTSSRYSRTLYRSDEATPQRWDVGMNGTKDFTVVNSTAGTVPLLVSVSTGGVSIMGTSTVKGIRTATATIDFGTINAGSAGSVHDITLTGAAEGDSVIVDVVGGGDWFPFDCVVNKQAMANKVSLRIYNGTGSNRTIGSRTVRVTVISF